MWCRRRVESYSTGLEGGAILGLSNQLNPRIALPVPLDHLHRAVSRRIIDADDFDVVKRLGQTALDRCGDELFVVVQRHDDRDAGLSCHVPSLDS